MEGGKGGRGRGKGDRGEGRKAGEREGMNHSHQGIPLVSP